MATTQMMTAAAGGHGPRSPTTDIPLPPSPALSLSSPPSTPPNALSTMTPAKGQAEGTEGNGKVEYLQRHQPQSPGPHAAPCTPPSNASYPRTPPPTSHGHAHAHEPYTPNNNNSCAPPTLYAMLAQTPGCKRKRSIPDFGGIPLDIILAASASRSSPTEPRTVITPRRLSLQATVSKYEATETDSSDTDEYTNTSEDIDMEDSDDDDDDIEFCI